MTARGIPVLLTRPEADGLRFAETLREAFGSRVAPVVAPMVEIVDLPAEVDWTHLSGVIVSSRNAARRLKAMGMPEGLSAYSVGHATTAIAQEQGAAMKIVAPDADTFITRMSGALVKGQLLHIRGDPVKVPLAARLRERGVDCGEAIVYIQRDLALGREGRALLEGTAPVILPVFSPAAARRLASLGPIEAPLAIVAISDAAAAQVPPFPNKQEIVARNPDGRSMIKATGTVLTMLEQSPPAD